MMKHDDTDLRFWFALMVGVLLVYVQYKSVRQATRVFIAGISGAIGYIVAPEIELPYVGPYSEVIIVTGFSFALIDIGFSIVRDASLTKGFLRKFFGIGGEK